MHPVVCLRRLSRPEGQALQRIVRRSPDPIARKRAACVLAAASGMSAPQISQSQFVHASYVRLILHAFNAEGLASIGNRYGIGRPRTFTDARRAQIIDVALTPPAQLDLPFTVWSIPKLREVLIERQIVATISVEWLRQILREAHITPQRTKAWKQSPDVDYLKKKTAPALL